MGTYSNVEGIISYDLIEDQKVFDQIKTFVDGDGIIDGLNEGFGERGRNHTYSMFKEHAKVTHFEISIYMNEVKVYDLKEEITVIVKFLNDLGVTGIDVDIERKGEDGYEDTEHFKIDGNGKVVSAMAEVTYKNYN